MDKNEVMALMKAEVGDDLNVKANAFYENNINSLSCWQYWDKYDCPKVIYDSYPVYIQERAEDKGKKAFEILKMLKDKKLIELKTVADFIETMDVLIKVL